MKQDDIAQPISKGTRQVLLPRIVAIKANKFVQVFVPENSFRPRNHVHLKDFLAKVFLPAGYPESVSPGMQEPWSTQLGSSH